MPIRPHSFTHSLKPIACLVLLSRLSIPAGLDNRSCISSLPQTKQRRSFFRAECWVRLDQCSGCSVVVFAASTCAAAVVLHGRTASRWATSSQSWATRSPLTSWSEQDQPDASWVSCLKVHMFIRVRPNQLERHPYFTISVSLKLDALQIKIESFRIRFDTFGSNMDSFQAKSGTSQTKLSTPPSKPGAFWLGGGGSRCTEWL